MGDKITLWFKNSLNGHNQSSFKVMFVANLLFYFIFILFFFATTLTLMLLNMNVMDVNIKVKVLLMQIYVFRKMLIINFHR